MENQVRVLLVEDDAVDQMAFRRFIAREHLSYHVVFVESVSAARVALSEQTFDIALVDYLIGSHTAFDLIDDIGDMPVIVITGRGDEEIAVKAMKAGARDYLVKDARGDYLKTLPIVIENTIARRRAESELVLYREHLEELVKIRTAELAQTNEQLLQEINERKQAEESLRQYTQRLNILRELDQTILRMPSSEGTARAALHHLRRLVPCAAASVILCDKASDEFHIWVVDGDDPPAVSADRRFSAGSFEPETERFREIFTRGRTTLIEDRELFSDQLISHGLIADGMRSILNVPLIFQQEQVGVLMLVACQPHAFGQTQMETACDVGNQLAIAISQWRLHEQVQRHATELEARVVERTAELQSAHDRLQILGRAKDEFVSNVSHELRTPITNIKLYHDLLDRRPDRFEHYAAVLRREINRLESLIEALLMLSRLDQDREKISFVPCDLNELLRLFVMDRQALAWAKGITLSVEVGTGTQMIEADRRLLEQVLSILLTNALAYTPQGGNVTVRSLNRTTEAGLWAGFSVHDTGAGVGLDEQKNLFVRFFRGKAGRDSHTPGTGLGLAIAKEIIDRHKGTIEVHSEGIGHGTEFSVWLMSAPNDPL